MSEPLLRVEGLVKRFGGLVATNNLSLDVAEGELHALIGPNGAGKTTFISQLAGELRQDKGTIRFDGKEITPWKTPVRVKHGLARSFQITQLLPDYTALDNVAMAVQSRRGHSYHFWSRCAQHYRCSRRCAPPARSRRARYARRYTGQRAVAWRAEAA